MQDETKAVGWLERAATKGHPDAQYNLGACVRALPAHACVGGRCVHACVLCACACVRCLRVFDRSADR